MAVYRRSARPRFILVLLVLTSVTLVTLDAGGQGSGWISALRRGAHDTLAPVQSAADRVLRPVGDVFGGIFHYGHLKAENRRLRHLLDQARAQGLQAADAERERDELSRLDKLDYVGALARTAVTARVVATSPSNFQLTVELDRGTAAGVAKGMPVVTAAGLVGRVVEVSRRRSTVLLLTDPQSDVGIRFPTSNDVGVAKGGGREESMSVDFVDLATKVAPGEVVVTSGLQGSVFPAGIPVGRVRSVRSPKGALQQEVSIDPVADLAHVDLVKVLVWLPAPAPPPPLPTTVAPGPPAAGSGPGPTSASSRP